MSVLQRKCAILLGAAIVGLLAFCFTVGSVQAAIYSWTGATSNNILEATNWDPVWTTTPGTADELDITNAGSFIDLVLPSDLNVQYFDFALSPARTISGAGILIIGSSSANGDINTWTATGATTFTNAGIILNRASILWADSTATNPAAILNINTGFLRVGVGSGSGNPAFRARGADMNITPTVDFSTNSVNRSLELQAYTGRTITLAGGITSGGKLTGLNLNGQAGGKVVLGGPSDFTFNVSVLDADLEIRHGNALGTTDGYTSIKGGNWGSGSSATKNYVGSLMLAGGINTGEHLYLEGRVNDNTSPQLRNISGNNTVSGIVSSDVGGRAAGTNMRISSDGTAPTDFLTIAGNIDLNYTGYYYNSTTRDYGGTGKLYLQGEGNALASGGITESPVDIGGTLYYWAWDLAKEGNGTWTLSGTNTYTGGTTVNAGTLNLSGPTTSAATVVNSGTLAISGAGSLTTPSIDLKSGTQFDVSAKTGGYDLGARTLFGNGTVLGNVTASSGSIIAAGEGNVGNLTFNSALSLTGGTTLQYDLSNDYFNNNDHIQVNGNLSLAGVSTVAVNLLNGGLANGSGTYHLIDYTGSLTGNVSNLTLSGIVSGTTRQTAVLNTSTAHQVNLIVTGDPQTYKWRGGVNSNKWDIGASGTSNWTSSDQKFFNLDTITFDDTGSTSPNVNLSTNVSPAALTFSNSAGHDYTLSGTGAIVAPTMPLTVEGTGTVTFANSAANVFSSVNLSSGTLAFNQSVNAVLSNVTGMGSLQQNGTNVLTLSGDNTGYNGDITVNAGTLKLGSPTACGNFGAILVNAGGTLDVNSMSVQFRTVYVSGAGAGGQGAIVSTGPVQPTSDSIGYLVFNGDTTLDATTQWWSVSMMDAQGYKLTKTGASEIDISGGETGLGDIDINGGMLGLYGNSTTHTGTTLGYYPGTVTIRNNATLAFLAEVGVAHSKPIVIDSTGGQFFWWGCPEAQYMDSQITLNGELTSTTRTFSANDPNVFLTGKITGTGDLTFRSTGSKVGIVTITGSENDYTGKTNVYNNMTLWVGKGDMGGTLGTGEVTLNGAGVHLGFNRADTYSINNLISGTGRVSFDSPYGVVTLTNANTYNGTTDIVAGTLIMGNPLCLQNSTLNLDATYTGVLDLSGVGDTLALGGLTGGQNLDLAGKNLVVGGSNLFAGEYLGVLSNAPTITKVGTGETDFGGDLVNVGNINIQGGWLYFNYGSTMGNLDSTVTISNGALLGLYHNTVDHMKPIVVDTTGGEINAWGSTGTISAGLTLNGNVITSAAAGALILNGPITGSGGLTKINVPDTSGGTVYLTSDNNAYIGTTTITSGTLSIGNGGTTGSLGGTGNIADEGTLQFDLDGTYTTSSKLGTRDITGTGGVAYGCYTGVVTIDKNFSYTGNTDISHGVVILKTNNGLGAADSASYTTVYNNEENVGNDRNGILKLDGSAGNLTIGEKFRTTGSGGANEEVGPGIIQNIAGNNVITGQITLIAGAGSTKVNVLAGTLDLQGPITLLSGTNGVTSRNLNLDGTGGTVSGPMSDGNKGVLGVSKYGPGTWTISSPDNTYTGDTTINAGKVILAATGQISTGSLINNHALFQVDGGTHTLGTIVGEGGMYVLGNSNVTATSITQGTLSIGGTAPASATAVPEPSTWLLLIVGSGLLAMFLRKKAR